LSRAKRESFFPIGMLGQLAEMQLKEKVADVPIKELKKLEIKPFQFQINSSLTVIFTGFIEGVFSDGLCVMDKKTFKNAVKAWPYFLFLNATDSAKRHLFFAGSNETESCFFDDPHPFLFNLVEHFFYAKEHPLFFALDWVEPILKKDTQKLAQYPVYDTVLQWQLKGRGKINYQGLIDAYHPIVQKLYREIAHAWF